MIGALVVYEAPGFEPIGPCAFNPVPGAMFLALDL